MAGKKTNSKLPPKKSWIRFEEQSTKLAAIARPGKIKMRRRSS